MARRDGNLSDAHPEVLRFVLQPSLLVARYDFLGIEYVGRHPTSAWDHPDVEGMASFRVWPLDSLRELDWYPWVVEAGWKPVVPDSPASPWEDLGIDYKKYRRERDVASAEALPTLVRDDLADLPHGHYAAVDEPYDPDAE